MKKAVFLDRDGVLIEDTSYPGDAGGIRFLPGIGEAVKKINGKGYLAIVVTNQSGIARGYFTKQEVEGINKRIEKHVRGEGGAIARFYYCPHHPNDNCGCRKPKPGMLLEAGRDYDIDFTRSYMIGDKLADMQAGEKAGCKTILITKENADGYVTAGSLLEAADRIE